MKLLKVFTSLHNILSISTATPKLTYSLNSILYTSNYFQAMLEKAGWLLLLLWLSGLLGPPEDSLRVALEGGLAGPIDPPPSTSLLGMDPGSEMALRFFFSFFPSAKKLPIITC